MREELRRLLAATPSLAPATQQLLRDVLASFLEEDESAGALPADELLEAFAALDEVANDPSSRKRKRHSANPADGPAAAALHCASARLKRLSLFDHRLLEANTG